MLNAKSKVLFLAAVISATACGGSKHGDPAVSTVPAAANPVAVQDTSTQVPPSGGAALTDWLKSGTYKTWNCEATPHTQRFPSPHGLNRICSNTLLAKAGPGEYPVGAASVKEIYNGDQVVSYAVEQHISAGTTADTWHWFAQLKGVIKVDGNGATSPAKAACVACHSAAGSDDKHSGHDFVYTQVK